MFCSDPSLPSYLIACCAELMEDYKVEFLGEPCGQHGPYTFYRALRYRTGKQKWSTLALGQFFHTLIKLGSNESSCYLSAIGELQLLWFDRNHEGLQLASVRLYLLPEDLPSGRLSQHGQDEILSEDEKFVLRVEDLLQWVVPARSSISSRKGVSGEVTAAIDRNGTPQPPPPSAAHCTKFTDTKQRFTIVSYSQYCRYRSLCKRLENIVQPDVNIKSLLLTIGGSNLNSCLSHLDEVDGVPSDANDTRIFFCRDTCVHPDLQKHAFRLDHLAPVLKGRRRKKKATIKHMESEDSNESETSSEKNGTSSKANHRHSAKAEDEDDLLPNERSTKKSSECHLEKTEKAKFLKRLHGYLKKDGTLAEKPSVQSCKEVDFFHLFKCVQSHGGYKSVRVKRMWKRVFHELGSSSGPTGTIAGTRKNYERFLLPFEKRLQKLCKKKDVPGGISLGSKLTETANGNDENCHESPTEMKSGRLVIRLPLKYRMSPEDKSASNCGSPSPPLSDDDKPLSVKFSRNRLPDDAGLAKKKKTVAKEKLPTDEEDLSTPSCLVKPLKVKKVKPDKHAKRQAKAADENKSAEIVADQINAKTSLFESESAGIDESSPPSTTMTAVSSINPSLSVIASSTEIKRETPTLADVQNGLSGGLHNSQANGVSYDKKGIHSGINDASSDGTTLHGKLSDRSPVSGLDQALQKESSLPCQDSKSRIPDPSHYMKAVQCGLSTSTDGQLLVPKTDDIRCVQEGDRAALRYSAAPAHAHRALVHRSVANVSSKNFSQLYESTRNSPGKISPCSLEMKPSTFSHYSTTSNKHQPSASAAVYSQSTGSSNSRSSLTPENGRVEPDKLALGSWNHSGRVTPSNQALHGNWAAKRRYPEEVQATGRSSADIGSVSTIMSPIKQFVDRARSNAISSSVLSKCHMSGSDSAIGGYAPMRDSVLRYGSTDKPSSSSSSSPATSGVPLDLSTKRPKLMDRQPHLDHSVVVRNTRSVERCQDEPLDLSKPLPNLMTSSHTAPQRTYRHDSTATSLTGHMYGAPLQQHQQHQQQQQQQQQRCQPSNGHAVPSVRSSAETTIHSSRVETAAQWPSSRSNSKTMSRPPVVSPHTANLHMPMTSLLPSLPPLSAAPAPSPASSNLFSFIPPSALPSYASPNQLSLSSSLPTLYDLPASLSRTGLPNVDATLVSPFLHYLYAASGSRLH